MRAAAWVRALRIGAPLSLVLLWQVAVSTRLLNPGLFPPPSAIAANFVQYAASGELATNAGWTLSRLLVVTENYPQLKSDALFHDLMSQLEGTENRITVARNRYIKSGGRAGGVRRRGRAGRAAVAAPDGIAPDRGGARTRGACARMALALSSDA